MDLYQSKAAARYRVTNENENKVPGHYLQAACEVSEFHLFPQAFKLLLCHVAMWRGGCGTVDHPPVTRFPRVNGHWYYIWYSNKRYTRLGCNLPWGLIPPSPCFTINAFKPLSFNYK